MLIKNASGFSLFKNNTYCFILLLFSLFIFSCKSKQAATITIPPKPNTQVQIAEEVKPQHEEAIEAPAEVQEIGISLLMPFDFENNLKEDTSDISKQHLLPNSLPWIEFYEGAKLAADSFNTEKVIINFELFDSEIDSGLLASYIAGINLYKNKVLIAEGPAWTRKLISKNASKNKAIVVFPNSNAEVFQNTVQLVATNDLMIEEMSEWLLKDFENHNIVIVHSDNKREIEIGKLFSARIDSLRSKSIKSVLVNYSKLKTDGLLKALDVKKKNLIIVTSSNEAFVSPLVNVLIDKADEFKITLIGLPTWENFEAIDIHSLEKLNTLIFSSRWIDYQNTELTAFRKKFIHVYKTDPLFTAYVGFYFIKGISESIKAKSISALDDFSNENKFYNQELFLFVKQKESNSITNHLISVLKYQDFNLVKQN